MRRVLSLLALPALAACAVPMMDRVATPTIVAALETQADGYTGATEAGERFKIVSTSASQSRLCRVVQIESANRFEVESFCKAPGGTWR